MSDKNEGSNSSYKKGTPKTSFIISPKIKLLIAIILTIGISISLYYVVKGTYINRPPIAFSPGSWVNLDEKNPVSPNDLSIAIEKTELRIAVAPIISPERSVEMYKDFVDYLSEKIERTPVPIFRQSYAETNELVRYKLCDIAVVCTYPFIRGENEFGMEALVIPQVKGKTTYSSLILVPRSSKASSLLDLRGKRFASADMVSTTGWLYPAMWLMQNGQDPNKFFGKHMISGSHDRSLQAVSNGYVDGAAVHSLVYQIMMKETPDMVEKTRILQESPPFCIPPVVANPDLDDDLKKQIIAALLDMHNNDRGRKILETLQVEKFITPPKGHFDDLRQAVRELEARR